MFNQEQLKKLNSELDSSRIKSREKGNIQLSYLEGHDVIDTANKIFGFGTGIANTLADAHEGGAKEAITDCLKRNFKSYGNQMGLCLYSKDKNHNHNSNNGNYQNQQNYKQPPVNNNYQQHKQPYQHQQDFQHLINLGLQVVQSGDNLIVTGDNVFANKDTIKAHGFRWDGQSKSWYMQLRQAA